MSRMTLLPCLIRRLAHAHRHTVAPSYRSRGTRQIFPRCKRSVNVRGRFPMGKSDNYRRFAAECMKIAHAAEDEQQRAIFVEMARSWLALAQKGETNADRDEGLDEETN